MEMVEILEIDSSTLVCHLTWQVYLIDESTLKAMDILEGVQRGRYRRCARCAVELCMKKAPESLVEKADHQRAVQDRGGQPQVPKCPKFQNKQDFLSGNLIAAWPAWHLRSRLSILFSCLFVF